MLVLLLFMLFMTLINVVGMSSSHCLLAGLSQPQLPCVLILLCLPIWSEGRKQGERVCVCGYEGVYVCVDLFILESNNNLFTFTKYIADVIYINIVFCKCLPRCGNLVGHTCV